jgi:heme-degrading monooxygenase HmoA
MFARHVTIIPKGNSASELTLIIENEIIPMLSKQKGFREEITFVAPEGSEVVAISLWDTKEDAEAYSEIGYPEVLKALSELVEGTPKVRIFEVSTSTLDSVAARTVA